MPSDFTDSGYASLTTSTTATSDIADQKSLATANAIELHRRLRPSTKLYRFNGRDLTSNERARSRDLKSLVENALPEYFRQRSKPYNPRLLIIQPCILGETRDTARPWLVIGCDPAIKRTVKSFFKRQDIIAELRPTNNLPTFDQHVCDRRLLLTSGGRNQEVVVWLKNGQKPGTGSACGLRLRTTENECEVHGTLGGIIEVKHNSGGIVRYGLTTGHFFGDKTWIHLPPNSVEQPESVEQIDTNSTTDRPPGTTALVINVSESEQWDDDSTDDDMEDYEIEVGGVDDAFARASQEESQLDPTDGKWVPFGRVAHVSYGSRGRNTGNQDWALIELNPTFIDLSNDAPSWSVAAASPELYCLPSNPSLPAGCPRPVGLAKNGINGSWGVLTNDGAAIVVGPSQKFSDAFTLKLPTFTGKLIS